MDELEKSYENIISKKDREIGNLKQQLFKLNENMKNINPELSNMPSFTGSYGSNDFKELMSNENAYRYFEAITTSIKADQSIPKNIPSKVIEYYLVNEIIAEIGRNPKDQRYGLTSKGNYIYKEFFNKEFSSLNLK